MARMIRHYTPPKRGLFIDFSCEGATPSYVLYMTVRRAIDAALTYEKMIRDCEVSVTFCDNAYIQSLNSQHRGKDAPTDVLSFPLSDDIDEDCADLPIIPLGDIVISVERASEQAKELGNSFLREIAFLAVHSTLHLLGYDHERSEKDDEDMCRRQREIVDTLGIN